MIDPPFIRLAANSHGELAPARLVILRQAPLTPRTVGHTGSSISLNGARHWRIYAPAALAASEERKISVYLQNNNLLR